MSLFVILAICCFICAAILAGIARSWPICLIAVGLALLVLAPAAGVAVLR